eukprot:765677-Hanusia_phi.AAC.1
MDFNDEIALSKPFKYVVTCVIVQRNGAGERRGRCYLKAKRAYSFLQVYTPPQVVSGIAPMMVLQASGDEWDNAQVLRVWRQVGGENYVLRCKVFRTSDITVNVESKALTPVVLNPRHRSSESQSVQLALIRF